MATPSRTRAARPARKPFWRRRLVWVGAAAVLLLAGAAVVLHYALADERTHHVLPVRWPEDAPHGEPFRVGHAVRAGDIFLTTVNFQSGLVLGFGPEDPFTGMRLDGTLRVGHGVTERPGGLASTVRVVLHLVSATYYPMQEAIAEPLRAISGPYTVEFQRGPDGTPIPGSVVRRDTTGTQRRAVDTVTAGLGDVLTDWVPDRPIRLGETWDVAEVSDVLPHMVDVLRRAAFAEGEGFPEAAVRGRVGAEALEVREGEPCVRLRIACSVRVEGNARPPAAEAWFTAAARVEGHVWVSTAKGIVWGMELEAELESSYMLPQRPQLRHARQRITATTVRADEMPQ